MKVNQYEGTCIHCGALVAIGAGHVEKRDGAWKVWHPACAQLQVEQQQERVAQELEEAQRQREAREQREERRRAAQKAKARAEREAQAAREKAKAEEEEARAQAQREKEAEEELRRQREQTQYGMDAERFYDNVVDKTLYTRLVPVTPGGTEEDPVPGEEHLFNEGRLKMVKETLLVNPTFWGTDVQEDMPYDEARKTLLANLLTTNQIGPLSFRRVSADRKYIVRSMLFILLAIQKYCAESSDEWCPIGADRFPRFVNRLRNFHVLRFWGLVRPCPQVDKPGVIQTGLWKITPRGKIFLSGGYIIPLYAFIYSSAIYSFPGREDWGTVSEALRIDFPDTVNLGDPSTYTYADLAAWKSEYPDGEGRKRKKKGE